MVEDQADAYNLFSLKVLDCQNNVVPADVDTIQIAQGKYPALPGGVLVATPLPRIRSSGAARRKH
jgi:hypothetical protein